MPFSVANEKGITVIVDSQELEKMIQRNLDWESSTGESYSNFVFQRGEAPLVLKDGEAPLETVRVPADVPQCVHEEKKFHICDHEHKVCIALCKACMKKYMVSLIPKDKEMYSVVWGCGCTCSCDYKDGKHMYVHQPK